MQRFLQELAKTDFLVMSKEFSTFGRMKGDLNQYFTSIARDRPVELLAKYRKALNLDEHWDLTTLVNAG